MFNLDKPKRREVNGIKVERQGWKWRLEKERVWIAPLNIILTVGLEWCVEHCGQRTG